MNLAVDLRVLGVFDGEERLGPRCYAAHREWFGPEYEDTLAAVVNLAVDLRNFGDSRQHKRGGWMRRGRSAQYTDGSAQLT